MEEAMIIRLPYYALLLFSLMLLSSCKSKYFSLSTENINLYYHRTAIMTLLKAKASSVMRQKGFPQLEKLIYAECKRDANSPCKLAKCVAILLQIRDQISYRPEYVSEEARHQGLRQKFVDDLKYLFNIDESKPLMPTNVVEKNLKPVKEFYIFKRKKREMKEVYRNVENLKTIERYARLIKKCHFYLDKIQKANHGFLKSLNVFVDQKETKESNLLDEIFHVVETFKLDNFAILSPRILPFLPSVDSRKKLISPTLLSFNRDGVLPLPEILKSTYVDSDEQTAWLDMLLDISGTSNKLEELVLRLQPSLAYYEGHVLPAIEKMETLEKSFQILRNTLTFEQQESLNSVGYAFLNDKQLELVYGNTGMLNLTTAFKCSKDALDAKLEEDIRALAKVENNLEYAAMRKKRFKRDDDDDNNNPEPGNSDNGGNSTEPGNEEEEMWPPIRVLRPWAFANRMNEGVVLEAVILSPHAFFAEIVNPEFLNIDVLSPRAFQPAILSPAALLSRVLSPLAFGAEVLSPRAFIAYILSPETFTAEVLSPQFFEAHILSPEAFNVQILSPNIIGPRIASPEANSILILSPNILSPRLVSKERMMIEILSPHVLGGEETEDEEESNLHSESELPEAHKYHNHSRGRFGPPGTEHEHPAPVSFFPFGKR